MTVLNAIIFLIFALVVLFGLNYFLCWTIINFFSISGSLVKSIILLIIFLLTISFITSSALAHVYENSFTRVLYGLSSYWLGLFANLILACLAAWLVLWLARAAGIAPNKIILGAAVFLLALACSLYGVWNGFNPIVKNIDVEIKNLPPQWKRKKIVQLSDIHLGHINRVEFLSRIVEKINAVKPDLIVITGDLFDGMDGDLSVFAGELNKLAAPAYFVTGNHETYLGLAKADSALGKTKIKILNDEMTELDGLQLIGASYPAMGDKKDIKQFILSLKKFNPQAPNILLYHTPYQADLIKDSGIDLQLSGHTHDGQIFPINLITKLIYGKFNSGLAKVGDLTVYTSSGTGTWGPPMRTGSKSEITVINLE